MFLKGRLLLYFDDAKNTIPTIAKYISPTIENPPAFMPKLNCPYVSVTFTGIYYEYVNGYL